MGSSSIGPPSVPEFPSEYMILPFSLRAIEDKKRHEASGRTLPFEPQLGADFVTNLGE